MILMLGGDSAEKMSEVHEVSNSCSRKRHCRTIRGPGFSFLSDQKIVALMDELSGDERQVRNLTRLILRCSAHAQI